MDFNLDDILATASKLDEQSVSINDMMEENGGGSSYNPDVFTIGKGDDIESILEQYTGHKAMSYYGQTEPNMAKPQYNLESSMEFQKALYDGKLNITESGKNVPHAILESIKSMPLNVDPTRMMQDNSIDAVGERAQSTMEKFNRINEQLEKLDREKRSDYTPKKAIAETPVQGNSGGTIDYSLIKMIVKECLAENNAAQNTQSGKCGIMLMTDTGFKFRDAEDNIFECTMKYVGKAKKKK